MFKVEGLRIEVEGFRSKEEGLRIEVEEFRGKVEGLRQDVFDFKILKNKKKYIPLSQFSRLRWKDCADRFVERKS